MEFIFFFTNFLLTFSLFSTKVWDVFMHHLVWCKGKARSEQRNLSATQQRRDEQLLASLATVDCSGSDVIASRVLCMTDI